MSPVWKSPLHAAALGVTFLVAAWPVTEAPGLAAGVMGACMGVVLAQRMTLAGFRYAVVLALGALLAAAGAGMGALLQQMVDPARSLGTHAVLQAADVPRWLGVMAGLALVLRGAAERWRAALVLEGAGVVAALASTVAAHRDGMIARPWTISDWFWTHGVDPVVAFLGLGVAVAVVMANVLARRRSLARTVVQMTVVLMLALLVARHIHSRDAASRAASTGANTEGDADNPARSGHGQRGRGGLRPDEPQPGSNGRNHPVAVVVFHNDVKPSGAIHYFRHTAFSQYNGIRLVEATRPDVDVDIRQGFPTRPVTLRAPPPATPFRTEVATDTALMMEHRSVFALTDALILEPLTNPDPARFRRAWRTVSSVVTSPYEDLLDLKAGSPDWADDVWQHYTAAPRDPRYQELAAQLRKTLRPSFRKLPLAMAMAVKRYLETTTTYSYKRRYEDERDPTGAFLFSTDRKGYCVHLAHSAAMLLRTLRVPARVSAGYAVPAENLGQGSALLIKQDQAHAWAEIHLAGVGWVPIEVTPEKTDVPPRPFQEQDLQQLLGEMARRKRNAPHPDMTPPVDLGALWLQTQRAAAGLLLALLAMAYAIKMWRLAAPVLAPTPRVAYRAALDRLSAVGVRRHHGETPEDFARRIAGLAPSMAEVTNRALAARLGNGKQAPGPQTNGRLATEIRQRAALWRWALGIINPVNWIWSR